MELGKDTDNFTGKTKNITFTDYKEAHTTNRLIDANSIKHTSYNNINELEHARSNIKELTEEELLKIEHKKQKKKEYENNRIQNLEKYDKLQFDNFNRLNKLMLR